MNSELWDRSILDLDTFYICLSFSSHFLLNPPPPPPTIPHLQNPTPNTSIRDITLLVPERRFPVKLSRLTSQMLSMTKRSMDPHVRSRLASPSTSTTRPNLPACGSTVTSATVLSTASTCMCLKTELNPTTPSDSLASASLYLPTAAALDLIV